MSAPRLATSFWVAAKLRQITGAGGYVSIIVKGHDEAGAVNLILRQRDGTLRLAVPAIMISAASSERRFEWRGQLENDAELSALIARELRFDSDQWFIECECSIEMFEQIFELDGL